VTYITNSKHKNQNEQTGFTTDSHKVKVPEATGPEPQHFKKLLPSKTNKKYSQVPIIYLKRSALGLLLLF
jgi:hypothetical protein